MIFTDTSYLGFFYWSKLGQRKECFTSQFVRTITPLINREIPSFNRTYVKVRELRFMHVNKEVREKCLTKTSGVIVLVKSDVKFSLPLTNLWSVKKKITCWWISCNLPSERTYIKVTYKFLVREIFGLRRGVTVFTGRYSCIRHFKKNSLVVPLSWQTKLATLFIFLCSGVRFFIKRLC